MYFVQDYMGMQKIRDIARRCRLAQPFEQWCIAYAATASWKEVHPSLRELLAHTFSGWIQSRINEKANKVWRDSVHRTNQSQKATLTTLWEKLSSSGVIEEFERDEITDDEEEATVENQIELDALYEQPANRVTCGVEASAEEQKEADKENKWLAQFDRISRDEGKAFNPETQQLLTAELRLLRLLHEKNLWHKANDAWLTSLLPVGSLIEVSTLARPMLWVLKTNECAALCWPGEQGDMLSWAPATDNKELEWYTCFDLKDVRVLNLKVLSPLGLRMQDIQSISVGSPRPPHPPPKSRKVNSFS